MATTLVDWQVNFMSERLAEYSGNPRDDIVARLRDGLDCGLCRETWIVEEKDGTRSRQPLIDRIDFFHWWMGDGLFPIRPDDRDKVWPRSALEDKVVEQVDYLSGRWGTHAGGSRQPDFNSALIAVCDAHAVFRWSEMLRSLSREDFLAWYKVWPFSSTLSAVATTMRAVSVDDLWPPRKGEEGSAETPVNSWKLLSPAGAVRRAAAELSPEGYLPGMHMKKVTKLFGDYIVDQGGDRPSGKTFERELPKLKPNR